MKAARIPPAPALPPAGTKLNPVSKQVDKNGCWRLLSDEWAFVLKPVCDPLARPVTELSPCEKFNVVACRWGYPDFEQTHPAEYNALKHRFMSGEFPPMQGTMPPTGELEKLWPSFLVQKGNLELWREVADDEMREHWLVPDRDRSPAGALALLAQETPDKRKTVEATVTHAALESIRYAAIFVAGDKRTIVYLREFVRDSLTVEEMPHTPGHAEREKASLSPIMAVVQATARGVEELVGKKKKKERSWYAKRGKAAAKWRKYPMEVIAMCKHANKFIRRDTMGKALRGCLQTAVTEARGYWKRNTSDPATKIWIDKNNVSNSTLERWILRDWRKER